MTFSGISVVFLKPFRAKLFQIDANYAYSIPFYNRLENSILRKIIYFPYSDGNSVPNSDPAMAEIFNKAWYGVTLLRVYLRDG